MRSILFMLVALSGMEASRAQLPGCMRVNCIADSLQKGAHAVMRVDEMDVVYQSPGRYHQTIHQVVTVLDDSGAHYFHSNFYVDQFRKVTKADISVLDANGQEVRKYSRKDFSTLSLDDGFSLARDASYISLDLLHPPLPCSVEFTIDIDVSSSISTPSWSFVSKGVSVETSRYTVALPIGLFLKFKKENGAGDPSVSLDKNTRSYVWNARNLPSQGVLDKATGRRKFPRLLLGATPFQYGGYKGDSKDWTSLGKWFWDLYQESTEPFSPQRQEEIRAVFKNAGNYQQVVEMLYRYMQQHMRYVSIQLGIGGFKPFPVSYVEQNKYGDCKALTNYMRYLLKEAGINSYPALVNAGEGEEPIDTSFASSQFNHVILCVLLKGGDTCWLECTSKYNKAGELGAFTENRYALLLTELGGKIVATPKSKALDNELTTREVVELDADGGGKADLYVAASGDFLFEFQSKRVSATREEWKSFLISETGLRQPDASIPLDAGDGPGAVPGLKVAYDKIPIVNSGGKVFLPARLVSMTPEHEWPASHQLPLKPLVRKDTTMITLPPGFRPQTLPPDQHLLAPGGSFHATYHFDQASHLLTLTAELTIQNVSEQGKSEDLLKLLKSAREEPSRLLIIVHD